MRPLRDLLRLTGFGSPPPGWWMETDGKRWRWAEPTWLQAHPYRTRRAAVAAAWRRLWAVQEDKARKWRREGA